MTRATALVCTKDRSSLLEGCLSALASSLGGEDELIVVESGESGAAAALAGLGSSGPAWRCIGSDRAGKSHQLNLGIRAAKGELLVLTDDDVRVERSWVDQMVEPFANPSVGLVCGRVHGMSRAPGFDRPHQVPNGTAPFETWTFAHGAAMAVRTEAAWQAGGFDERLGPGRNAVGEDHDFLLRVRERGWGIVVSSAPTAVHVDWRSPEANRANAVAYERGGGAIVGAAIRRRAPERWRLLERRLAYQRSLFRVNRRFAGAGLVAFAGGLLYGLALPPRTWLTAPAP